MIESDRLNAELHHTWILERARIAERLFKFLVDQDRLIPIEGHGSREELADTAMQLAHKFMSGQ